MNPENQYGWIDELYAWADRHQIPDLQFIDDDLLDDSGEGRDEGFWIGLPRDRDQLLALQELNLSWHNCTEIPEQLRYLKNLKALSFAKSQDGLQPPFYETADGPYRINDIPVWISELADLEELDLSRNNIEWIPEEIAKLKKLKRLYLNDNPISYISPRFEELSSLEVLWINTYSYPVAIPQISTLPNLREIWMDGIPGSSFGPLQLGRANDVEIATGTGQCRIPLEGICRDHICSAIENLEQAANQAWINELYRWAEAHGVPDLQFVYGEIGGYAEGYWVGLTRDRYALLGLEELDLSWHSLSAIPEQIRNLKTLKKLSVAKWRDGLQPPFQENADGKQSLEEIPAWINELASLEVLDLSNNNIIYVPAAVGQLENLKKLNLKQNRIVFFAPEVRNLLNLEVLWIRSNKISIVNECVADLRRIRSLKIDWHEENKVSLICSSIDAIAAQSLYDDVEVYAAIANLQTFALARSVLRNIFSTNDNKLIWEQWRKLSDVVSLVGQLTSLRELYCDGIRHCENGPITLCDDGITTIQLKKLDNDDPVVLSREEVEERILLICKNKHKTLGERIEELNLWADLP